MLHSLYNPNSAPHVCYFSGEGIAVNLLGLRRDVQFEILISMYSFPSIGRPAPFRSRRIGRGERIEIQFQVVLYQIKER